LQEYLSLFKGPLPQGIINALITLFNLDKTTFEARDQALINMAGPEVADLSLFVWLWLVVNDRKFSTRTVFFSHTNQPAVLLHKPATIRTSQPKAAH